ncbi:MAG: PD-(D/E)XK nuclease family protein [Bacteroidota bacterium]
MTPFLKELAGRIIKENSKLDDLTFIFPNKRAALYFEKYLSSEIKRPLWAPAMYSIEEFFKKNSDLREPDKLTLIFRLYQVYTSVLKNNESFDRFYFWGEMLLRDFDEIDKYLVDATQLFKDLSKIKELDETFDYLTDEQKLFLKEFWMHFSENPSITKDEFLIMWKKLPKVYSEFTKALRKESLGYEGMIHRDVAESLSKKIPTSLKNSKLIFAGFNALTKAEEKVISALVANGAKIYWDADQYYVENDLQEAGQFMREYRKHEHLSATFDGPLPKHFLESPKKISLTAVPQRIGQAKLAGLEISAILKQLPKDDLPAELSKTVIVLPDESMLLPMMHSLPDELLDINVTMGFPLRDTPLFNLLDQVIEMQVKKRTSPVTRATGFNHREVNAILGHAYFLALAEHEAQHRITDIVRNNRVYVPIEELLGEDPIFATFFKPVDSAQATDYLLELVEHLGSRLTDKKSFDREYAYHFHQHISRLHTIFSVSEKAPDWRGFQKLFRQVMMMQKIPFTGEPLRGLQIMGVLETRNLDFDNVIILSLNEGQLPSPPRQGSYVPHAIRRAYALPTWDHQDAIYAYLFYRLLQRASNISFYYSTEPDIIGNGEMSRYLQQVIIESKLPIEKRVLHNPIHVHAIHPIVVDKTAKVMQLLDKFVNETPEMRSLSPSSLNDYIECSLRFYLKQVAQMKEADEVEEEVDARVLGSILHDVAFWLYGELRDKRNGLVNAEDLSVSDEQIDRLIDRAFREFYHMKEDEPVVYEGKRIVVKEIVKTFLRKVLERDSEHAPFEIRMLEEDFNEKIDLPSGKRVRVGGKIDRADATRGTVRIVDYKTGVDELKFDNIVSLFDGESKHNKAAFQTILYAYVYFLHHNSPTEKIQPGLMNRNSLFGKDFKFGLKVGNDREPMEDVKPMLQEFGQRLHDVVGEIFNPFIPFKQTSNTKSCMYCLYKSLCRR